jgi:serine/threonine protein kinase
VLARLGRYDVDELLARGGMGEVYRGRLVAEHGFVRPIVIKLIRTELLADERAALMFIDEARMAAGLHHRNVLQIVDFDRFEGGAFLVTELVEGCDLRVFLQHIRAVPRYDIALTIITELATGLHAAHEATAADGAPLNLVHRDVSPSNVLLGRLGEIKLSDFGVAKARMRSYHTVSGTIKGKAPYMAPEQILGEPVDRRADVFSLGVLLFEVTTRTRLYSASADVNAMKQIIGGDVPDPAERRPGYPPELARIVRKALARNPDARYATAQDMVDDLDALARERKWNLSCSAVGDLVRAVDDRAKQNTPAGSTPLPGQPARWRMT